MNFQRKVVFSPTNPRSRSVSFYKHLLCTRSSNATSLNRIISRVLKQRCHIRTQCSKNPNTMLCNKKIYIYIKNNVVLIAVNVLPVQNIIAHEIVFSKHPKRLGKSNNDHCFYYGINQRLSTPDICFARVPTRAATHVITYYYLILSRGVPLHATQTRRKTMIIRRNPSTAILLTTKLYR